MAPSREFMVRQATLDALHSWYPQYGTGMAARKAEALISGDWFLGIAFRSSVAGRYIDIRARYAQ